MSFHGIGAGPGPTKTYKVDMPFPWGKDTEIVLPVQTIVDDLWTAILPKLNALETKLIGDMEEEVAYYSPTAARKVLNEVILPAVDKELEVAFAKVDVVKEDALKAGLAITATVVLAVGLAAWWIKKG